MMNPEEVSPFAEHLDPALRELGGGVWAVWYHAGCQDGSTSATVAREAAFAAGVPRDRLKMWPVQYGGAEPDWEWLEAQKAAGEKLCLHVVDFSWEASILRRLSDLAFGSGGLFRCLDHHDSAMRKLRGEDIPGLVLDSSRSGARLTWDHCFPTLSAPMLVQAVEDADLWRWSLGPVTHKVWQFFGLTGWHLKPELEELQALVREAGDPTLSEYWKSKGGDALCEVAEDQLRQAKRSAVKNAHGLELQLPDGSPVMLSSANASAHRSDVGHALCEAFPKNAAAVWRLAEGADVLVSLRAPSDDFKVNLIAEVYGGGGHPAAASFKMPWTTFCFLLRPSPPADPAE